MASLLLSLIGPVLLRSVLCFHHTAHCLENYLPLPVYCVAVLFLGFSKHWYYECNACGCQSGDAGKGECGEDQLGREIRSPSVLGRPVPERECQLLCFNFCVGLLLIPSLPAAWMKGIIFVFSLWDVVVIEAQVCDHLKA